MVAHPHTVCSLAWRGRRSYIYLPEGLFLSAFEVMWLTILIQYALDGFKFFMIQLDCVI